MSSKDDVMIYLKRDVDHVNDVLGFSVEDALYCDVSFRILPINLTELCKRFKKSSRATENGAYYETDEDYSYNLALQDILSAVRIGLDKEG